MTNYIKRIVVGGAFVIIGASTAASCYADGTSLASGLRAYHKLSDTSDLYLYGYNLTNNGSSTFTAGKVGNGVDFGASNSSEYLSILNNLGLTAGGNVSWAGWVKVTGTPANGTRQGIFSVGNAGAPNVYYQAHYSTIGGVTGLRFDRLKQITGHDYTVYPVTLTPGQWYFLAFTYDGSTASIYVDNVLEATGTPSGNGAANSTSDHYYLGALEDTGTTSPAPSNYGSLAIDEAGVWNRALTTGEIGDLFRAEPNGQTIPATVPSSTGLLAYHELSDTHDAYMNGYDLTNNGSAVFDAGKVGNGVDFGTSNSTKYLSILNSLGLTAGGNLSWAGWVKVSGTPANGTRQGIFSVGNAGAPNVYYQAHYSTIGGVTGIRFDRLKQNVAHDYTTYATSLTPGIWNFMAFTYDGTTASIYVNGVLEATSTPSGNGGANSTSDHYYLGALEDTGTTSPAPSNYGSLAIDEAGVWKRALSSSEVSSLYNGGAGVTLFPETNLRAYHALENGNDGFVNGYNLTNNGSAVFDAGKVGNGVDFGTSNSASTFRS